MHELDCCTHGEAPVWRGRADRRGGGGNVQSDADSGPVDTWGGAEPLTVRMQGGWHALASGLPQSDCD
jgi:hypothetical protein